MAPTPPTTPRTTPRMHVVVVGDGPSALTFDRDFTIGRTRDSGVCIPSEFVSRSHAGVRIEHGRWWVRDLNSSNGLFVEETQIDVAPIDSTLTIRLGIKGPSVIFRCEAVRPAAPPIHERLNNKPLERYFGKLSEGEAVGEHAIMVRRAFQKRNSGRDTAGLWPRSFAFSPRPEGTSSTFDANSITIKPLPRSSFIP